MLFKDLVRKFLLQQKNQVTFESSELDSRVIHSPDHFRILTLRERLQFLQPRERVVQIQAYLNLQDYLNLNLKSEDELLGSNHLQSSKSTWLPHSSKESWRSMTTQSTATRMKKIKNCSCFKISDFKSGIKEIFRVTQKGCEGSHQKGAHLTQHRSWSIWPSPSQSTIKWRSGEDHWVKVGHRTQVRSTQSEICGKRIHSDHWQRVKVCSHPTSYDTQGHTPHESDSSMESLCVRCSISVSQYATW